MDLQSHTGLSALGWQVRFGTVGWFITFALCTSVGIALATIPLLPSSFLAAKAGAVLSALAEAEAIYGTEAKR